VGREYPEWFGGGHYGGPWEGQESVLMGTGWKRLNWKLESRLLGRRGESALGKVGRAQGGLVGTPLVLQVSICSNSFFTNSEVNAYLLFIVSMQFELSSSRYKAS
jgi:hypothetical protein